MANTLSYKCSIILIMRISDVDWEPSIFPSNKCHLSGYLTIAQAPDLGCVG